MVQQSKEQMEHVNGIKMVNFIAQTVQQSKKQMEHVNGIKMVNFIV
jgi:hypothetical protein